MTLGVTALRINFSLIPIIGVVLLCITFFQAIGKAKPSIILTLVRQVIALIPFIIILPYFFGVEGIFFAQPISDLITLAISVILIKKSFEQLTKLEVENF